MRSMLGPGGKGLNHLWQIYFVLLPYALFLGSIQAWPVQKVLAAAELPGYRFQVL